MSLSPQLSASLHQPQTLQGARHRVTPGASNLRHGHLALVSKATASSVAASCLLPVRRSTRWFKLL